MRISYEFLQPYRLHRIQKWALQVDAYADRIGRLIPCTYYAESLSEYGIFRKRSHFFIAGMNFHISTENIRLAMMDEIIMPLIGHPMTSNPKAKIMPYPNVIMMIFAISFFSIVPPLLMSYCTFI